MEVMTTGDGWPVQIRKNGWLGSEVTAEQLTYELTASDMAVLRELIARHRSSGESLTALDREKFSDPRLDPLLQGLVRRMKLEHGLAIISGVCLDEFTREELEILFWGIGTHFGIASSQNLDGDMMGQVRVRPNKMSFRAYSAAGPLAFHTDKIDILALFSLQSAQRGGATLFKSGLAIWDAIARERPDYLEILKRGFYWHRSGQQPDGEPAVTPHRVPIFAQVGELRSCVVGANADIPHQTTQIPGGITPEERQALAYFDEVRNRAEFLLPIRLRPGQMIFINNHEILHGREDFVEGDTPEKQRLLLRLWLAGRPWRPIVEDQRVIKNRSGLQGMDPKREVGVHELA